MMVFEIVFDIGVVDCITCFILAKLSRVHGALDFPYILYSNGYFNAICGRL